MESTDPYAQLLPAPLVGQEDARPPATDFDHYTLPGHERILALEATNPHPRDEGIRFIEEPHLYLIKTPGGEHQVWRSVTTVAGSLARPFDADAILKLMRNPPRATSQRWPRAGYCVDQKPLDDEPLAAKRGLLMYSMDDDGKPFTHASLDGPSVARANLVGADRARVVEALQAERNRAPARTEPEYATFKRALTDPEIKDKWAADANDASRRGTEAHFQAEQYLNGLRMHPTPELDVCRRFCRDHLLPEGARPYRTEWEIYTDPTAEGIAGSIDLVVEFPDGTLGLVDWKRSPKLITGMWGFPGKRMLPPFDHLDGCDGAKYALQLNIYAWVLERYYGKRVTSLTLCSIHPDKPFATGVPFLPLETEYLMSLERRRTAQCRAVLSQDEQPGPRVLCELSGAVRTHPKIAVGRTGARIEVQHGALFAPEINEPPMAVEDDPEGQQAVHAALMRAETPVEDECVENAALALAEGRVEWTEVMPKPVLEPMRRKRPREE